jgi:phospholipase/lecithinase/hemolysin
MVSTALDRVLSDQLEIPAQAGRRFSDLVRQIADGQEADRVDVAAILSAAKKSPADLRDAVMLLGRRRELRKAIAAAGAGVATMRAEIEAAIRAADEVLAVVQREHAAAVGPLVARLDDLTALELAASAAKSDLIRTCDPRIRGRMETTRKRLEQLQKEAREVDKLLTDARDLLRSMRSEPHRFGSTDRSKVENRIIKHEAAIKELSKSTAAASTALDAAYAEMIES